MNINVQIKKLEPKDIEHTFLGGRKSGILESDIKEIVKINIADQ